MTDEMQAPESKAEAADAGHRRIAGYGGGTAGSDISTEAVSREAEQLAESRPTMEALTKLAGGDFLRLENFRAGYGKIEILHGLDLALARGKALCLIGPNGAGKSTVLHGLYGLADRLGGRAILDGRDIGKMTADRKLSDAKIAYVLQDNSIFPEMTVEENLLMGGYSMPPDAAAEAMERVFAKYDRLAQRRGERAGVLSGGERRLLEISRALATDPAVLLVDEPSIGLEPRYIDMVFDILQDLRESEGRTILMVEQNAKKGLAFADIGYVLTAGRLALADTGEALLENPDVGRLFLGG